MDQRKFIEREVELLFDTDWEVIKLDEHRYYKSLSGQGLKAVDFIAVHMEMGIAFIELKNYQQGKDSIPVELDKVMKEKRDDSIRIITVINKYYQRQWYFKLLSWIGWSALFPKEWKTWIDAQKHVDRGNYFFLGIVDH